MNIGLVGSFVIAGILLISILSFNINVSQSSTELTMEQVMQRRASTLTEVLQKDFPNIASDTLNSISDAIEDAREDKIVFRSDIDYDGITETITWEFTDIDINNANPDDKVLIRKVDGDVTEFKSGITNFKMEYFDADKDPINISLIDVLLGGSQAKRNEIRYININFTIQSQEKIGGAGLSEPKFLSVHWSKQFTPINLGL